MYSQNDTQWRDKHLGTSDDTLAKSGCKVTCFAEVLSRWGYGFNPATLNELLTDRFYVDGCLLADEVLPQIFPWIEMEQSVCEVKPADFTKLQKAGNEEIVLRLQLARTHFVLFNRMEAGVVYIDDPADGTTVDIAKYGATASIITKITKFRNPLYAIPLVFRMDGNDYTGRLALISGEYTALVEARKILTPFGCGFEPKISEGKVVVTSETLTMLRQMKEVFAKIN